MSLIIRSLFVIALTASFGEVTAVLLQYFLYKSINIWSEMDIPQKYIAIGGPGLGVFLGIILAIVLCISEPRRRSVVPAPAPAPAPQSGIGENDPDISDRVMLTEWQSCLRHSRKPRRTLNLRFCRPNQPKWIDSVDLACLPLFQPTLGRTRRPQHSLHRRIHGMHYRSSLGRWSRFFCGIWSN